jgi:hypothetical protein
MRLNRVLLLLLFAALAAWAQTPPPAAGKTDIPRLHDGKPDLNGVWQIPYTPDMSRDVEGGLPFSFVGAQDWGFYDATEFDYTGHCLPPGLTRLVNTPNPMEIVQTPKKVVLLFEGFNQYIVVPTDGRKHSEDPYPTWFGESIGWYEGDTLVIDTIGFNGKARLDTVGHPFSSKLHLVQRYTRTSEETIEFEVIVEDPVMYTRPFRNKRTFRLRPDWELMEYSCMENNRDLLDGHIKSPFNFGK